MSALFSGGCACGVIRYECSALSRSHGRESRIGIVEQTEEGKKLHPTPSTAKSSEKSRSLIEVCLIMSLARTPKSGRQ